MATPAQDMAALPPREMATPSPDLATLCPGHVAVALGPQWSQWQIANATSLGGNQYQVAPGFDFVAGKIVEGTFDLPINLRALTCGQTGAAAGLPCRVGHACHQTK